ncbi:MAG: 2-octaprenyl-6-methoxyphenyl hydroxylase [Woeseiaceae bacterium]|nr:2-octaprenyl-6-methoxyphenyl hydroxylase [Woeseiaceae bacterium]
MSNHYDIVIAGGGMIGTSLALALRPIGLRVAVVEPVARGEPQQPSFDERTTALSRSTQRMFDAMGLWPDVMAASTPIRHIHVSDAGRFGFSRIDAEEQGVEALGHVVINRVLGEVLQDELKEADSVTQFCPASVEAVDVSDERATVTLDTGELLTADLLVAADGARSQLRDLLHIGASVKHYGQTAIIGNLLSEKRPDGVAYERFTTGGPIAFLPMSGGRTAFVWVAETSVADELLALDDETFTDRLYAAFGTRLGRFSKIGKRSAYPLSLSKASRMTATRSVLVGNAAHGLHPVAAQGFNLGMRDVAALCDCISDARRDGDSIAVMLERYADWRKRDQGTLVRITDSIVEVFGSTRPATRFARNVGMLGFDLIPGVRKAFAKQMMGLNGKLPRLSRGVPLR